MENRSQGPIYLGIRFFFYSYYIVDEECDGIEALKKSWKLTENIALKLFGFILLMGILNLGGAMLCLVGLLITVPISMMATVYVYRTMLEYQEKYEEKPGGSLEPPGMGEAPA